MLIASIFLPRLTNLDQFIAADEPRWQANVAGFTTKLARGDIGNLLQQPHPGITTQWFAAPGIWSDSWAGKKMPLVIAQCLLLLASGYLVMELWGKRAGFFATLFLALDPFFIAHTRVYAMDSLLAIFCLISLLALLVWNKTQAKRYLVFAGMAAALAFLSKLPGIMILPYNMLAIMVLGHNSGLKNVLKMSGIWIVSFIVTSVVVLPSFLVRPIGVLQDMAGFFTSGDYTSLHQYGPYYYLGTIIFLTTLVQVAALGTLALKPKILEYKKDILLLFVFAILFVIMMTLGAKKGDRYILPAFVIFDVCAAYIVSQALTKKYVWAIILIVVAVIFQAGDILRLHPYELAYVNPITKPFIGHRQLGWGEGLDIAAAYLNSKQHPEQLKVATYYASQFQSLFRGETAPLHQWDSGSNDYAIVYRAMYGRSKDSWETDVLDHFKQKNPEKIILLDGVPYIWIYKLK